MPFALKKILARDGIYLLLLVGFAFRLLLITHAPNVNIIGDQEEYRQLAQQMQAPREYQNTFRMPGYPAYLALVFTLFSDTLITAQLAQALLSTVTIALLYAFTLTLFARRGVALLASALSAGYLELAAIPRLYYSETLFFFLLVPAFYLLVRWLRDDMRARLLGAGAMFAGAALTRELTGYFVLLVVPLWLLIICAPQWRRACNAILLVWAGAALLLLPWAARNWMLESRILLFSTEGEYNFAKDNARLETALGVNTSPPDARTSLFRGKRVIDYPNQIARELAAQPPAQRSSYALQRGLTIIGYAPLAWLLLKEQQLRALWKPPALDANYLQLASVPPPWSAWLNSMTVGLLSVLWLAAPIGFFFAPRNNNAAKLLWLLFILYSLSIFLLTHYQDRYRLPLLVVALPYAAYGVVVLTDARRARFSLRGLFQARTVGAAFVCFLFVILMWQ